MIEGDGAELMEMKSIKWTFGLSGRVSREYEDQKVIRADLELALRFWGAKGAPILFSLLGIRMASCSYIYIYIYFCHCKWRRSSRSLQSFKSSLMMFRRV